MKFLLDEKGSMTPLWAIGGCVVLLSILVVDNVSWSLLEKIRQMSSADTLTRVAMIEEGMPDTNVDKILSAVGATDSTAFYKFENNVDYPDLETIDEQVDDGRMMSPFSSVATSYKTASVPFAGINDSLGLSEKVRFSTTDRAMKLFKPVNIIIAVENTPENIENFSQARTPLINALRRLFKQAPSSRVSLVPYSFRINYRNSCYTGIERGDNFDFSWWEMYYNNSDKNKMTEYAQLVAMTVLEKNKKDISDSTDKLNALNASLEAHNQGTEEYHNISEKIDALKIHISNVEEIIPQLEKNLDSATNENDKQKEIMQSLENSKQYGDFRPLALHYGKNSYNYKLLEDYTDEFANSNGYRIDEGNFLSSSVKLAGMLPQSLDKLAVKRNGMFSDNDTCPSVSVVNEMSSASQVSAAFSRLDFNNNKVMSLEGLLWAGRQANSINLPGSRNVIIFFASEKDDVLDENRMLGVSKSCNTIKDLYFNQRSSKIIFVVKNLAAMAKFNKFNCATKTSGAPGYIVQDDIDDNFSEQMELNFMYLFSQESTTRDGN